MIKIIFGQPKFSVKSFVIIFLNECIKTLFSFFITFFKGGFHETFGVKILTLDKYAVLFLNNSLFS